MVAADLKVEINRALAPNLLQVPTPVAVKPEAMFENGLQRSNGDDVNSSASEAEQSTTHSSSVDQSTCT